MIWIAIMDSLYWPLIQFMISYWVLRTRWEIWDPDLLIFRALPSETAQVYHGLGIRYWKRFLPDGAQWLGFDFKKDGQNLRDLKRLRRFISETCRSEFAHGVMLAFSPLPFLWNPIWAGWVMLGFGLLLNFPCLLVQRYNRIKLRDLQERMKGKNLHLFN